MSVEVRIPTILRPYTGGDKIVTGEGANLGSLIADLDSRHQITSSRHGRRRW